MARVSLVARSLAIEQPVTPQNLCYMQSPVWVLITLWPGHEETTEATCRCRKSGLELKRIAILCLSCTMGHGKLFTMLWPRKFVRVDYVFVFFTVVYTELDIACSCWCRYCTVPLASCCRCWFEFWWRVNIMPIPSCTCLVLHSDVWPTFCSKMTLECKSQPSFFATTFVMIFCIVLEF